MENADDPSFEFESTVPTDLTISSFSDETVRSKHDRTFKKSKEKDRKEYLRELHLLNNELSRKNTLVKCLQTDLDSKTKILEAKLRDCEHDKQISQAKILTQMRLTEQQAIQQASTINKELDEMRKQIRNWDNIYENVMKSLENFQFSEKVFLKMKMNTESAPTLDLHNYVMIKIHELIWNFKKENEDLLSKTSNFQDAHSRLKEQFSYCQEDLRRTHDENKELHERVKTLSNQTNTLKSRIEHGNYALENFTRVKEERDEMQKQILNLKKTIDKQNLEVIQVTQEKENLYVEKTGLQQKFNTLEKENDSFCHQVNDVTQKWGESQDEAHKLKFELSHEKSSREELLQRFINMRDKLKKEYEERITLEVEKTKTRLVQQYEMEIRTLKETKHSSDRNREAAELATTELRKKYEELYKRFESNAEGESKQLQELQKELDGSKVEKHKLFVNHSKLQETYKEKCIDLEKMSVKLKLTEDELSALRMSSSERLQHLETELGLNRVRLESFEKMEREVDEVINEAAKDEAMPDEALVAIADQISLPTKARYSFNKCVHLMRKALQLERRVVESHEELHQEKEKNSKMSEELSHAFHLLEQVDQPHSYLITNIRENDILVKHLRLRLVELEKSLQEVRNERDVICEERNVLAADLEQVLENKEQITKIKQQLTTLQSHHQRRLDAPSKSKPNNPTKKTIKTKWK